jgi:hypothetical protein
MPIPDGETRSKDIIWLNKKTSIRFKAFKLILIPLLNVVKIKPRTRKSQK